MKAHLTHNQPNNAENLSDTKELINRLQLIARPAAGKPLQTIIDARFYMGKSRNASAVYCSVWVSCHGDYRGGHGTAGGSGYHKESRALAVALKSAGVTLDTDIAGRGEGAMLGALEAVAVELGAVLTPGDWLIV
jgi:hypothetical protein